MKILIVDDDDMIREIYTEVFKKNNFDVVEAKDGLEGLDKVSEDIPDIIFTGIVMPRMSGFDLMEALKKDIKTAQIPVVISSHLGREEDRKKAMELGAKDFFIRNFDTPNEVLAKVKSLFEKSAYWLRFNTEDEDARKLAKDIFSSGGYDCDKCHEKRLIKLEMTDLDAGEFKGRFVCPKCE